jgi:hypothetical protein
MNVGLLIRNLEVFIIIFGILISLIIFLRIKSSIKNSVKINENKKNIGVLTERESILLSFIVSLGSGSILLPVFLITENGPGTLIWIILGFIPVMFLKYAEVFFSLEDRKVILGESFGGIFKFLHGKNKIIFSFFIGLFLLSLCDLYQFTVLMENFVSLLDILLVKFKILFSIKEHGNILYFIAFLFSSFIIFLSSRNFMFFFRLSRVLGVTFFTFYLLFMVSIIKDFTFIKIINLIKIILTSFFQDFSSVNTVFSQLITGVSCGFYAGSVCIGSSSLINCEGNITSANEGAKKSLMALLITFFLVIISSISFLFQWQKHSFQITNINVAEIVKIFAGKYIFSLISLKILLFFSSFMICVSCLSEGAKVLRLFILPNVNSLYKSFIKYCIAILFILFLTFFSKSSPNNVVMFITLIFTGLNFFHMIYFLYENKKIR